MNNEVLVKVEGVSKKFCRNLKRSLWYGVKDISSEPALSADRPAYRQTGCLAVPKTWGVDDVSHRVSESKRGYLIRGEQMDETLFYILVNLNTYGKYSV